MKKYITSAEVAKNKDILYVSEDYDWGLAVNSKALMVYVYDENKLDVPVPITAFDEDEEFWRPAEPGDLPEYHRDSSAYHSAMRFIFEEDYDT
jgi:hypothetical protein